MYTIWDNSTLPKFIKCLESLPNLHTLEIGWSHRCTTTPLESALKGVELPQIKALVLPPAAYPLLQHCRDVEDVVCVVKYEVSMSPDEVLGTLTSNQDSKVKRLAIPLVSRGNSSRKRFSTPSDHRARTVVDYLQSQDMWPRVQGSPNSPSSTLTQKAP